MKAAMQKRYGSVKAELEKAKKDMASGKKGILGPYYLEEAEKKAGKLIFDMLFSDQGSEKDLHPFLSKRILLEMMYATVDARNSIQGRVNQEKSRGARKKHLSLLYAWLDQNIHRYQRKLEQCAEDAVEQIAGLDMTPGTVKKHITAYRKQKRLAASKSENKSKKKTKVAS